MNSLTQMNPMNQFSNMGHMNQIDHMNYMNNTMNIPGNQFSHNIPQMGHMNQNQMSQMKNQVIHNQMNHINPPTQMNSTNQMNQMSPMNYPINQIQINNEYSHIVGRVAKVFPNNNNVQGLLKDPFLINQFHSIILKCKDQRFDMKLKTNIIRDFLTDYFNHYPPPNPKTKLYLQFLYTITFAFSDQSNPSSPIEMYDSFLTKYGHVFPLDNIESLLLCEFWIGLKLIMKHLPLPQSLKDFPKEYYSMYYNFASIYEDRNTYSSSFSDDIEKVNDQRNHILRSEMNLYLMQRNTHFQNMNSNMPNHR